MDIGRFLLNKDPYKTNALNLQVRGDGYRDMSCGRITTMYGTAGRATRTTADLDMSTMIAFQATAVQQYSTPCDLYAWC